MICETACFNSVILAQIISCLVHKLRLFPIADNAEYGRANIYNQTFFNANANLRPYCFYFGFSACNDNTYMYLPYEHSSPSVCRLVDWLVCQLIGQSKGLEITQLGSYRSTCYLFISFSLSWFSSEQPRKPAMCLLYSANHPSGSYLPEVVLAAVGWEGVYGTYCLDRPYTLARGSSDCWLESLGSRI